MQKKLLMEFRMPPKRLLYGCMIQFLFLNFTLLAHANDGLKNNDINKDGSKAFSINIKADPITVTGTVTDGFGEPIPGVTVSVQGTSTGTATDLNGNYTLTVEEGTTLTFSFIGFVTQNVDVGSQSILNVTLVEDVTALEEVVVV